MDKLDKNSKPYSDGRYSEFFEAAESGNMAAEDVVLYSQSLSRMRSYQSGLDYRFEEGREEGREEEREVMARKMKDAGLDLSVISQITEIPMDKLAGL